MGIAIFVSIIVLLALIVRLYFMVNKLNTSFAKLGYVVREDAKKYFDSAAGKIVDTNQQFQAYYAQIVHEGTSAALADAGNTLMGTLASAQKEAGDIVLQSREDARRILETAKQEAKINSDEALGRTAETIQWVMEQYIGKEYSIDDHKDIVIKLLDEYINERRT